MGWDELRCFRCYEHVGWMTDSGPRGMCFCDSCKELEDEEERERNEDDTDNL